MTARVTSSKSFPFIKYNCGGNDFVLFAQPCPKNKLVEFIKKVCLPKFGIGADGAIFVWKKGPDWHWRFFNADGSETKLCGNATRAVGHFLASQKEFQKKAEIVWKGRLGLFRGRRLKKDSLEVCWPLPHLSTTNIPDTLLEQLSGLNDRGLAGISCLNVGVPQLVLINHENWAPQDRFANNPTLRAHPSLGAEGTNVTWYSRKSNEAVTFERGVERETMACGSGAIALYLTLTRDLSLHKKSHSLKFKFPGGLLGVRNFEDCLWLSGPVHKVFEGEWNG